MLERFVKGKKINIIAKIVSCDIQSYLPLTSAITLQLSLITENVTLDLQHMEVLCYNGLYGGKTVIDIIAKIVICLQ